VRTTVARTMGHRDASVTARVYARDVSDDAAMVERLLARAAAAGN
jgi:integrase